MGQGSRKQGLFRSADSGRHQPKISGKHAEPGTDSPAPVGARKR